MEEQHHIALPKLYGAPAYARPPRIVEPQPRPFDPDDLPLEAFRDLDGPSGGAGGVAVASAATAVAEHDPEVGLEPQPFSLKGLARRIAGR